MVDCQRRSPYLHDFHFRHDLTAIAQPLHAHLSKRDRKHRYVNHAALKDALLLACRGFASLGDEGRKVGAGRSCRCPISQAFVAPWTDKFHSRTANRDVPNRVAPAAGDQRFAHHFDQTFMKWHKNGMSLNKISRFQRESGGGFT
jgi:hypothetical protein